MSDIRDVKKRLHQAGSALSVIDMFLKQLDPTGFDQRQKEFHESALRSLKRLRDDFLAADDMVTALVKREG